MYADRRELLGFRDFFSSLPACRKGFFDTQKRARTSVRALFCVYVHNTLAVVWIDTSKISASYISMISAAFCHSEERSDEESSRYRKCKGSFAVAQDDIAEAYMQSSHVFSICYSEERSDEESSRYRKCKGSFAVAQDDIAEAYMQSSHVFSICYSEERSDEESSLPESDKKRKSTFYSGRCAGACTRRQSIRQHNVSVRTTRNS